MNGRPERRWYVAWHPESDGAVLRLKDEEGLVEWRSRDWRLFPGPPEIDDVTPQVSGWGSIEIAGRSYRPDNAVGTDHLTRWVPPTAPDPALSGGELSAVGSVLKAEFRSIEAALVQQELRGEEADPALLDRLVRLRQRREIVNKARLRSG